MRYACLLLLLLTLLLPAAGEARRFRQDRWPADETIIVENRMGREWNEAIGFTVAAWKRVFPRLQYRVVHRPGRPCRNEPDRIVICEVTYRPAYAGVTVTHTQQHTIGSSVIRVSRTAAGEVWRGSITRYDMQTLCHEFGHALGLTHNPHPTTSCVANGSTRITPGPFDRGSLRLLYKQRGKHWP